MTFIEKVLVGEQNILKEYELIKARNERRRLSVFSRQNYGSILGSFSEDEESGKKQPRQGSFKQGKNKAIRKSMNEEGKDNKDELGINLLQNDGTRLNKKFSLRNSAANLFGLNMTAKSNVRLSGVN